MADYKTTAEVISDAAIELGLVPAEIANPHTITDPNIVQLLVFLKAEGRRLAAAHDWTDLQVSYTFPTVNGQPTYALPSDFGRIISETIWDRNEDRPLVGPATAQVWEALQSGGPNVVIGTAFRIFGEILYLYPTPTSVRTIAYQYQSAYWTRQSGSTPGEPLESDKPETTYSGEDIPLFSHRLLVSAVKLRYLKAKGMPAQDTQDEYDSALSIALGNSSNSASISIAPPRAYRPGLGQPPGSGWGL